MHNPAPSDEQTSPPIAWRFARNTEPTPSNVSVINPNMIIVFLLARSATPIDEGRDDLHCCEQPADQPSGLRDACLAD